MTDLGSDKTPTLSQDMKDKILAIKQQADDLRSDLRSLRRLQQINKESIVETVDEAWKKIRVFPFLYFLYDDNQKAAKLQKALVLF